MKLLKHVVGVNVTRVSRMRLRSSEENIFRFRTYEDLRSNQEVERQAGTNI